jgi:hypothetical protein
MAASGEVAKARADLPTGDARVPAPMPLLSVFGDQICAPLGQ